MIPELLGPAIDFYRAPRRFGRFTDRGRPLPAGISDLLAAPFHALSDEHIERTAERLGASPEECRAAVTFFIKQAMLESDGDHYRTLGVRRDADRAQIRRHYHYLMKLFHPDNDAGGTHWGDVYAPRINEAYNTLRDAARRAAYDADLPAERDGFDPTTLRTRATERRRPPPPAPERAGGMTPLAWKVVLGLVAGVALLFVLALAMQARQPQLHLKPRAQEAAVGKAVTPNETGPTGRDEPTRSTGVTGGPHGTPSADQRIEDMVKARVAQATRAVLGPEAARREPPAGSSANDRSRNSASAPEPSSAGGPVVGQATTQPGANIATAQPEHATAMPIISAPVPNESAAVEPAPRGAASEAFPAAVEPGAHSDGVSADTSLPAVAIAPRTTEPQITTLELGELLEAFEASYEQGDAAAFTALFSENARTTDAYGRNAIFDTYSEFFARPERREFELKHFKWNRITSGLGAGDGVASITTVPLKGGRTREGELRIDLVVERLASGLRITRLHYESR